MVPSKETTPSLSSTLANVSHNFFEPLQQEDDDPLQDSDDSVLDDRPPQGTTGKIRSIRKTNQDSPKEPKESRQLETSRKTEAPQRPSSPSLHRSQPVSLSASQQASAAMSTDSDEEFEFNFGTEEGIHPPTHVDIRDDDTVTQTNTASATPILRPFPARPFQIRWDLKLTMMPSDNPVEDVIMACKAVMQQLQAVDPQVVIYPWTVEDATGTEKLPSISKPGDIPTVFADFRQYFPRLIPNPKGGVTYTSLWIGSVVPIARIMESAVSGSIARSTISFLDTFNVNLLSAWVGFYTRIKTWTVGCSKRPSPKRWNSLLNVVGASYH